MRAALVLSLASVAGCRSDDLVPRGRPDANLIVLPDGRIVPPTDARLLADGGGVDQDPVSPTTCNEATQHSDLAWIQQHIFTPSCATARCHAGAEPEVGLSLEAGAAHANLVNRGSSTVQGWTRVVPGNPTASYLVVSLGRAPGPEPRDGFMPLLAEPLCTEMHEAIERWIAQGAPP